MRYRSLLQIIPLLACHLLLADSFKSGAFLKAGAGQNNAQLERTVLIENNIDVTESLQTALSGFTASVAVGYTYNYSNIWATSVSLSFEPNTIDVTETITLDNSNTNNLSEKTIIELNNTLGAMATIGYAISTDTILSLSAGYSRASLNVHYKETLKAINIDNEQSINGFSFGLSMSTQINEQLILDLSAEIRHYEKYELNGTGNANYTAKLSIEPYVSNISVTATYYI
ncbi:outer membrane beta-barrel protein [Candidatus Comchoanobacter bicostacola]|uniref:Outer membrane beta-barrel protein n=1 Tax=Candidatus Comchoanobacter bicostacola TaxID=2919598 RepID=A0ABY5DJU5_9GAMM|nr:outer membrane beta-barrel protein [Candidatus Comchoanobacter bicostacola]UTC24085.1 outer membrane beta-barrel protein [Candidatus Comchoanobacter bicostacola]